MTGHTLFDTPIGHCGIAWNDLGAITAFQLPEATDAGTLRRMLPRSADESLAAPPSAAVQAVIARIVSLLKGERIDLRDVPLDMAGIDDFDRRVYEHTREVLSGQTCTYGDIAAQLGAPNESRAVGRALGANPFAVIVPCHRVLAAGGKPGGFSAGGGVTTKLRILLIERAQFGREPGLF